MPDKPIEIKIDNKAVNAKLLELARRGENLRILMKNIVSVFAYSTEENFKSEGRPDKWTDLAESTKKQREKRIASRGRRTETKSFRSQTRLMRATKQKRKWPGQILQVEGKLAASVNTFYEDDSAVIGSNLSYAAIHQLGGQAGKNKAVTIPARPYLQLTGSDYQEILNECGKYLADN